MASTKVILVNNRGGWVTPRHVSFHVGVEKKPRKSLFSPLCFQTSKRSASDGSWGSGVTLPVTREPA